MKRALVWLGLLLATSLLNACDDAAEGTTRIAVIPKGTSHVFWSSIEVGARRAGEELGVEIIWKGPTREDDRDDQIKVVENFVARGVDGIVVAPLDDKALVRPLEDATKEGIPVVVTDSGVQWDGYVSFVATDNYRGGQLAAERLGALLDGKGKVIMMRYQEGSASTMKREAGFLETLQQKFPAIEVLSSNQYGGATVESSYQTAETLLIGHPQLDGIFCPNESTTFGMLRALQDGGRAGKVSFVGFDAGEKLIQALRAGEIHGLVLQDPFKMGELGVKTIVAHIEGKPVEKRIDTGAVVVTPENVDDEAMKQLHSPDLSRWLGE